MRGPFERVSASMHREEREREGERVISSITSERVGAVALNINYDRQRAHTAIQARITASHPNSEVKLALAGVVLWWGTTWEGPVFCVLLFCDVALFVCSVFCFSRRCRSQRGVPSRLRTVAHEPWSCVARGRETDKT